MASVSPAPLPEKNFCKAYLHLLHVTSNGQPPTYSNTHVASQTQLNQKGLSPCILGKMPAPKKQTKRKFATSGVIGLSGDDREDAIPKRLVRVTVKSIKPPKFTHVLENVDASLTILDLKQQLLTELDKNNESSSSQQQQKGLDLAGLSAVRLLLKGKVLQDSKVLEDFLGPDEGKDELSFIAMISATPAPASVPEPEPVSAPVKQASPVSDMVEIDPALWQEIAALLSAKLGPGPGSQALLRLKQGWEK